MFRRILPAAALVCAVFATPAHATDYDWTPAGRFSQARISVASTVLKDGRVLLAGGYDPVAQQDVATVDIYDPRTNTWAAGPPLREPRRVASAVTLADGRVLVIGGEEQADQRKTEIFDPTAGTWTPAANTIAEHAGISSFVLDDGRVLFLGAGNYSSQWPGGEIFDPATGTWKLTADPHEVGGAGQAVVRLRDGRFLVVGNKSVWADPISYDEPRAEIYDVASDTWTVVARPAYSGEGSGAALLPDGRVLVAGGRPGGAAGVMIDATAHRGSEIFDPATGTWSPTGDLLRPRSSGSEFVTLPDGRIAGVGGSSATIVGPFGQRRFGEISYEATAEVYDVASGSWQPLPSMTQAHAGAITKMLADGSMLVAGGVTGPNTSLTTAAERLVPRPVVPAAPEPPVVVAPKPTVPTRLKAGTLRLLALPKHLKPSRTGTLTVKVRCSTGGATCADRLVLRGRGRVLAQRDVSVKAGKTLTVRVKLSAAGRRSLRNRTTRVTVSLRQQGTKVNVSVRG